MTTLTERVTKLEQDAASIQAVLGQAINVLENINRHLGVIDVRLDAIEVRMKDLAKVEKRLGGIESRLDAVESRLQGVENLVTNLIQSEADHA